MDYWNIKTDNVREANSKKTFIIFCEDGSVEPAYQHMKANLETAIDRAEKLEEFHANTIKPSHLQCPCTKVHHLVKELLMARKIGA